MQVSPLASLFCLSTGEARMLSCEGTCVLPHDNKPDMFCVGQLTMQIEYDDAIARSFVAVE